MAGRYLISGAFIGVLKALIEADKKVEAIKMVDDVCERHFIGNSKTPILDDIAYLVGK